MGRAYHKLHGAVYCTFVKKEVFSNVKAASHHVAAKLFKNNPHFMIPRATIDVMEVMAM